MLKKKKKEDSENTEDINTAVNEFEQETEEQAAENAPSPVDTLKEELALANDKYLRLYAEFDNFRRRTLKEREDARKLEGKDLIVSLLPVLDDFERALKAMETAADVKQVKEGIELVSNKFRNTLSAKGLKPMESIGQPFNADLHEAITEIPSPTPDHTGKVLDEVQKGYYLNDKIIRFAKVVVGK